VWTAASHTHRKNKSKKFLQGKECHCSKEEKEEAKGMAPGRFPGRPGYKIENIKGKVRGLKEKG
jgi:hypothetical protein